METSLNLSRLSFLHLLHLVLNPVWIFEGVGKSMRGTYIDKNKFRVPARSADVVSVKHKSDVFCDDLRQKRPVLTQLFWWFKPVLRLGG